MPLELKLLSTNLKSTDEYNFITYKLTWIYHISAAQVLSPNLIWKTRCLYITYMNMHGMKHLIWYTCKLIHIELITVHIRSTYYYA
jgi:hypothetical protein